jgi:hypothetical protein
LPGDNGDVTRARCGLIGRDVRNVARLSALRTGEGAQ